MAMQRAERPAQPGRLARDEGGARRAQQLQEEERHAHRVHKERQCAQHDDRRVLRREALHAVVGAQVGLAAVKIFAFKGLR